MDTSVATKSITEKISTRIIPITLILVGFSVMAAAGLLLFGSTSSQHITPPKSQSASVQVEQLTAQLVVMGALYQVSPSSALPATLAQLQTLGTQRQALLKKILAENPKEFLRLSFHPEQLPHIPAALVDVVERPIMVEGQLDVIHSDDFTHGTSTNAYTLKDTSGKTYTLYFVSDVPALQAKSKLKVQGLALADAIAVPTSASVNLIAPAPAPAVVTATTVHKKVGVILYNFSNDTRQPVTPTFVRGVIFTNTNSVHAFYDESSFQQFSFDGVSATPGPRDDVFGWYTLPTSSSPCSPAYWANLAISAAQAAGVDLSPYDYLVTASPGVSCFEDGQAFGNVAFTNGWFDVRVIGHELGHLLGVDHANGLACGTVPISSTCSESEYNDPFDVMSNANTTRQFSAYRKYVLGWFQSGDLVDVSVAGTYHLAPSEIKPSPNGYPKALRIVRRNLGIGVNEYFYLDYRRPFGVFDNFLLSDPVVNGVSVRLVGNRVGWSDLIDANPTSGGYGNAAMALGQSITDPVSGVKITTTGIDAQTATVSVEYTCGNAYPTIQGTTTTLNSRPGDTVTYTLTMTNNDSTPCAPSNFSIHTTPPAGWTVAPADITLSAVAPHESRTATVTVTSPPTVADGTYIITETITNTSVPGITNSTTLSYMIDTTPPSLQLITTPPDITTLPASGSVTLQVSTSADYEVNHLFIDDVQVLQCDFFNRFCQYTWPMSGVTSGIHTIRATSADYWGNTAVITRSVTMPGVSNGGGGGTPCIEKKNGPPCPLETQ